jgi:hypothetical protein
MVSEFQKQLEGMHLAKADYCHEVKEIVDAIVYLEDDIAQAALARDALVEAKETVLMPGEGRGLDNVASDLRSAKLAAKDLLERSGCPAYTEY